MKDIIGHEAIRVMGRWDVSDIAYVKDLHYQLSGAGNAPEIIIHFIAMRRDLSTKVWPATDLPTFCVVVKFAGVRNLRLNGFGGRYTQLMDFDISNIADRGWEDIHYSIEDHESARLSFLCEDWEILEVKPWSDTFLTV